MILELEETYEIIEVIVNDESAETLIAPLYIFDLSYVNKEGENHSEINVTNNLSRNQRDSFSSYLPLVSLGITKPI